MNLRRRSLMIIACCAHATFLMSTPPRDLSKVRLPYPFGQHMDLSSKDVPKAPNGKFDEACGDHPIFSYFKGPLIPTDEEGIRTALNFPKYLNTILAVESLIQKHKPTLEENTPPQVVKIWKNHYLKMVDAIDHVEQYIFAFGYNLPTDYTNWFATNPNVWSRKKPLSYLTEVLNTNTNLLKTSYQLTDVKILDNIDKMSFQDLWSERVTIWSNESAKLLPFVEKKDGQKN